MTTENTNATKILSVEDILAAPDLKEETVEISDWGGAVTIRALTRAALLEAKQEATLVTTVAGKPQEDVDNTKLEKAMFAASLVAPSFTPEQVESVWQKAAAPVGTIMKRIMALNGLDSGAVKAAEKSAGS